MAVALSMSMRNALYSMSDISGQQAVSNKRLATGKKVNEVLDGPINYFLARGFDKNKNDLANLLDTQNIALSTVSKTVKSIESIQKLVESVQALARQARQLADVPARETLSAQIVQTLNQVNELTRDSGFNGKNLVGRVPDTLQIAWNSETGANLTKLDVVGVNLTAAGLGFGAAAPDTGLTQGAEVSPIPLSIAYTANSWTNDVTGNARIDALITQSQTALNRLESEASKFSVTLSITQIRVDYSKFQQKTLAQTSDGLTLADVNEEGANLAALQTRQQLSVQALSLANQADQGILRLF